MVPVRGDLPGVTLSSTNLDEALRLALSPLPDTPVDAVIWSDGDSEMVVRLTELTSSLKPGLVVIQLTVETDQTGGDCLVVPLSVGSSQDDAYLVALTESLPRGNALLASRWGRPAQDALWQALLRVGKVELTGIYTESIDVVGLFADENELTFFGRFSQ
jgi:hypothetical protein